MHLYLIALTKNLFFRSLLAISIASKKKYRLQITIIAIKNISKVLLSSKFSTEIPIYIVTSWVILPMIANLFIGHYLNGFNFNRVKQYTISIKLFTLPLTTILDS